MSLEKENEDLRKRMKGLEDILTNIHDIVYRTKTRTGEAEKFQDIKKIMDNDIHLNKENL